MALMTDFVSRLGRVSAGGEEKDFDDRSHMNYSSFEL